MNSMRCEVYFSKLSSSTRVKDDLVRTTSRLMMERGLVLTEDQTRDGHKSVFGNGGVLGGSLQQLELDVHDSIGQRLDLTSDLSDDGLERE